MFTIVDENGRFWNGKEWGNVPKRYKRKGWAEMAASKLKDKRPKTVKPVW